MTTRTKLPHLTSEDINAITPLELRHEVAIGDGAAPFVYRLNMTSDEFGKGDYYSESMHLLGINELKVPLYVAYGLFLHDLSMAKFGGLVELIQRASNGDELAGRQVAMRTQEVQRNLHAWLCRYLFDKEAAPDWYVQGLTATALTAETALRVLELRHAADELDHLRQSTRSAGRSSKAAVAVAIVSVGAALWSGLEARKVRGDVQAMEVTGPVSVEVRGDSDSAGQR